MGEIFQQFSIQLVQRLDFLSEAYPLRLPHSPLNFLFIRVLNALLRQLLAHHIFSNRSLSRQPEPYSSHTLRQTKVIAQDYSHHN